MKIKSFTRPLANEFTDKWQWNRNDKSDAVIIFGKDNRIAHFHSVWSSGTAGVRGTKPINQYNNSKYYWEVLIKDRVFGTSMMFGLTTRSARIHSNSFVNMVGEDEFGWGLSHKGLLWHNGQWKVYTKPFRENRSTVIGCLYDGQYGTLTYYKDGECLGIAFTGLDKIKEDLYPSICSTAAKTEFILGFMRRDYINLQDRCRDVIRKQIHCDEDWNSLNLPKPIISYLKMEDEECDYIENNQNSATNNRAKFGFQRTKIPMPDL